MTQPYLGAAPGAMAHPAAPTGGRLATVNGDIRRQAYLAYGISVA